MVYLLHNDYFSVSRELYRLAARMQVYEPAEFSRIGSGAAYVKRRTSAFNADLSLVHEEHLIRADIRFFFHIVQEIRLSCSCHVLAEHNVEVVQGYLIELVLSYKSDSSPYPDTRDQQRRASADSYDHHEETLLVPENIPDRHLVEETYL